MSGGRGASNPIPALNPAAWYRFNTGITVVGAGVDTWADQSGNGRDFRQTTDTNRPTKEADGSITGDGADNSLRVTTFTLAQPFTVYVLYKMLSYADNDGIWSWLPSGTPQLTQNGTTPNIDLYAGSFACSNTDLEIDAWGVVASVVNGASSLIEVDDNAPTTGNAGSDSGTGLLLFEGSSGYGHGTIKEMIVFGAAHNASQRAIVRAYLNGVGGL